MRGLLEERMRGGGVGESKASTSSTTTAGSGAEEEVRRDSNGADAKGETERGGRAGVTSAAQWMVSDSTKGAGGSDITPKGSGGKAAAGQSSKAVASAAKTVAGEGAGGKRQRVFDFTESLPPGEPSPPPDSPPMMWLAQGTRLTDTARVCRRGGGGRGWRRGWHALSEAPAA